MHPRQDVLCCHVTSDCGPEMDGCRAMVRDCYNEHCQHLGCTLCLPAMQGSSTFVESDDSIGVLAAGRLYQFRSLCWW
mgnify:CR=1 FL=1|jgi:hypothetical protein